MHIIIIALAVDLILISLSIFFFPLPFFFHSENGLLTISLPLLFFPIVLQPPGEQFAHSVAAEPRPQHFSHGAVSGVGKRKSQGMKENSQGRKKGKKVSARGAINVLHKRDK